MLKKQKSSLLPCPDGLQQLDLGVSLFRTHPLLNNSLRHYSQVLKRIAAADKIAVCWRARGKLMEVTLTIPDDVASEIQNGATTPLARRLLELAAIKAYEADLLTEWGVIDMLGLDGREELYEFFKRYDVRATHLDLATESEKRLSRNSGGKPLYLVVHRPKRR
jgi:hypothetical protein